MDNYYLITESYRMNNQINTKRKFLIKYLDGYLSKSGIRKKQALLNIRKRLRHNNQITKNQFSYLMKFIEREKEFRSINRQSLDEFFEPLIKTDNERNSANERNDLTQFLH